MKERPILFSGPMVRAILDGRKTQTRRVVKPQPEAENGSWWLIHKCGRSPIAEYCGKAHAGADVHCPYGKPRDQLWVRETWNYTRDLTTKERSKQEDVLARFFDRTVPAENIVDLAMQLPVATGAKRAMYAADFGDWAHDPDSDLHWRPSIFMPRWASRITLEITEVRVQRAQDISEADALSEGVTDMWPTICQTAKYNFIQLWDSINGKRPAGYSLKDNPWVWAISFKRITIPADSDGHLTADGAQGQTIL